MAGLVLPDYGGAWIPDTGGEDDQGGGQGFLPTGLIDILEKFGKNGIVISGVVTWIGSQIDTQINDAWKALAERCFKDTEVTAGKEALKSARGTVLENLVPDFNTTRKGASKKSSEIEDIRKALVALQAAGQMPLVIASSDQMVRCPQSWGVPDTATVQDVMGKVLMLEQVMADNMKSQKESMQELREELQLRRLEPRTPSFPEIRLTSQTPSKKRKTLAEEQPIGDGGSHPQAQAQPKGVSAVNQQQVNCYAGVLQGVNPLTQKQEKGMRVIQSLIRSQQQSPRPQRNICYGSARTAGQGTTGSETMLAADVSLVASGVGKGCTEDNLRDFLASKGVNPVEVEMLTREEVLDNVRTLTFRVAVKAADYEASLKPEVWPYRVAVRHYRAPRRDRSEGTDTWQGQSGRSGGQINRHAGAGQGGGQVAAVRDHQDGYFPPGHAGRARSNQQTMSKSSTVELSNIYSVLASLGEELGSK